ncbi:MAG: flagellar basal body-associated protein FliL [Burkholderiaceae bacterium]
MSDKSAQAEQAAPNKSKKLILILVAVLLLAGGGGAAAWMMLKKAPDAEYDEELAEAPPKRKTAPIFVPLDQFTINLADDGGERFAQVAMVLEVEKAETGEAVKAHMPAIRNSILLLLSSKHSKELLTLPGKEKLAAEVAEQTGVQMGWEPPEAEPQGDAAQRRRSQRPRSKPNPIVAVHFSHFIVQ